MYSICAYKATITITVGHLKTFSVYNGWTALVVFGL